MAFSLRARDVYFFHCCVCAFESARTCCVLKWSLSFFSGCNLPAHAGLVVSRPSYATERFHSVRKSSTCLKGHNFSFCFFLSQTDNPWPKSTRAITHTGSVTKTQGLNHTLWIPVLISRSLRLRVNILFLTLQIFKQCELHTAIWPLDHCPGDERSVRKQTLLILVTYQKRSSGSQQF